MLFFNPWRGFWMRTSRRLALLLIGVLTLSLCGVVALGTMPQAHAATPGPLVTAIDAGGSASGNFVADTDFDSGNQYSDTSTSINTGSVSETIPQAVWQTCRWNSAFTYTIPGLTAGATYLDRKSVV